MTYRDELKALVKEYGTQTLSRLLHISQKSVQLYIKDEEEREPRPKTQENIRELYKRYSKGEDLSKAKIPAPTEADIAEVPSGLVPLDMLQMVIESNRDIAAAVKTANATSNSLASQNGRALSLIERVIGSTPPEGAEGSENRLTVALAAIAKAGIGTLWNSLDDAENFLYKVVYGLKEPEQEAGNSAHEGSQHSNKRGS